MHCTQFRRSNNLTTCGSQASLCKHFPVRTTRKIAPVSSHSGTAFGSYLGFQLLLTSLEPMSNSKIHHLRFALLCAALLMPGGAIQGQSSQSACKSVVELKEDSEVIQTSKEAPVRPIKRAKVSSKAVSADWSTLPSTFTHDQDGQRVDQYSVAVEPQSNERSDFVRSGFRHTRSSLQAGFGSDHYHVTEQWGQPVQPYGQWRYPNRPFSVPYGQWGPQLPQIVAGGFPWLGLPNGSMNSGPVLPGGNWPGGGMPGGGMPGGGMPGGGMPGGGWPGGGMPGGGMPGGGMPGGGWPGPGGPNHGGNGFHPMQPNHGFGANGNGFNVGPWNALPADQDEYYSQAPSLRRP
jgi:hypothetical protein